VAGKNQVQSHPHPSNASFWQDIKWLPSFTSTDPTSTSIESAPSPTQDYARKSSVAFVRKSSIAFARRISGAFALFLVYWQGQILNDSDAACLEKQLRSTIREHNNTRNQQAAAKLRRGTYGQVGQPQDGTIEVYIPPYDKELLDKISHLPDVASVERPLPFHMPSALAAM